MVEFALLLPIFLVVLFLIIDFGVGISRWVIVTNSTREGARLGAVCDNVADCDIEGRVATTSNGLLDAADVHVNYVDSDNNGKFNRGESVVVESDYEYELITPLRVFLSIGFDSLTFHSCTDMRLELLVVGASNPDGVEGC
jgi:hypothetical protein